MNEILEILLLKVKICAKPNNRVLRFGPIYFGSTTLNNDSSYNGNIIHAETMVCDNRFKLNAFPVSIEIFNKTEKNNVIISINV